MGSNSQAPSVAEGIASSPASKKSATVAFANAGIVPLLLTTPEAAALLGVGTTTFHELRSAPWMPAPVQLSPRVVRWSRSELEDAISRMPRQIVLAEPTQLHRGRERKRLEAA
jgi:predicted DNA-binding transcriptional regulator AlpA